MKDQGQSISFLGEYFLSTDCGAHAGESDGFLTRELYSWVCGSEKKYSPKVKATTH